MSRQAKIRTKSIVEYKSIPLFNHDCENLENFLVEEGIITTYSEVDADWCSYNPNCQNFQAHPTNTLAQIQKVASSSFVFTKVAVPPLISIGGIVIASRGSDTCMYTNGLTECGSVIPSR